MGFIFIFLTTADAVQWQPRFVQPLMAPWPQPWPQQWPQPWPQPLPQQLWPQPWPQLLAQSMQVPVAQPTPCHVYAKSEACQKSDYASAMPGAARLCSRDQCCDALLRGGEVVKLEVLMSQSPSPLSIQTAMERGFGKTREQGPFGSQTIGGSLSSGDDNLGVVSRYTASGLLVSFYFKRSWAELLRVLQQVETLVLDLGSDARSNKYSIDDGSQLTLESFELALLCDKYW